MNAQEALQLLLPDPKLWLSSQQVGQLLDPATKDPKGVAGDARRREQVFAVWDGERYLYPAFQFDGDQRVRPKTSALVAVLPRDREDRRVNLDATLWVFSPTLALGERTPAEVFATDPDAVIALARRLRDGSPDSD